MHDVRLGRKQEQERPAGPPQEGIRSRVYESTITIPSGRRVAVATRVPALTGGGMNSGRLPFLHQRRKYSPRSSRRTPSHWSDENQRNSVRPIEVPGFVCKAFHRKHFVFLCALRGESSGRVNVSHPHGLSVSPCLPWCAIQLKEPATPFLALVAALPRCGPLR